MAVSMLTFGASLRRSSCSRRFRPATAEAAGRYFACGHGWVRRRYAALRRGRRRRPELTPGAVSTLPARAGAAEKRIDQCGGAESGTWAWLWCSSPPGWQCGTGHVGPTWSKGFSRCRHTAAPLGRKAAQGDAGPQTPPQRLRGREKQKHSVNLVSQGRQLCV